MPLFKLVEAYRETKWLWKALDPKKSEVEPAERIQEGGEFGPGPGGGRRQICKGVRAG